MLFGLAEASGVALKQVESSVTVNDPVREKEDSNSAHHVPTSPERLTSSPPRAESSKDIVEERDEYDFKLPHPVPPEMVVVRL